MAGPKPLKQPIRGSHEWVRIAEGVIKGVAQSTCKYCKGTHTDRENVDACDHTRARFLLYGHPDKR
jgi:hypothetical protein